MRKMKLTLVCLFSLCLCASCAAKTGDAALFNSPPVATGGEPSDDKPSIEPSPSPSPAPSVDISPLPTNGNMPVFDPLSPEGWDVRDWAEGNEGHFNEGFGIDFNVDRAIGDFFIGMTLEEAKPFLPSELITKNEYNVGVDKGVTLVYDGISFSFWDINNEDTFVLMSLEVSSKEYVTPRGLRVGDSAEKVFGLYGTPVFVTENDYDFPNTWCYCYEGDGFYTPCNIMVVSGVVEMIRVNGYP